MTIWSRLHNGLKYAENALFPDLCICCKNEYKLQSEVLCLNCAERLPFTDHDRYEQNEFVQHFWGRIRIEKGAALLTFSNDFGVREILHRIKYADDLELARRMGGLMASRYENYFKSVDAIVPVPLHRNRQKLRGYNQSQIIAEGLSAVWNIPIWSWALNRVIGTDTQTHKNRAERSTSMMQAFAHSKASIYRNHHLLLVDDVMTTGATLEACGTALQRGGPVQLSMMTLAMGRY